MARIKISKENTGIHSGRIFISYKRVDYDKVVSIKERIESELLESCWFDLDGIESRHQFRTKICNAIDNAKIVLFMYSKAHLNIDFENDWTIKELDYAQAKKKIVVLINIDNTPLDNLFLLDFGSKNNINISDELQFQKLLSDIRSWLRIANQNNSQNSKHKSSHFLFQICSRIKRHSLLAVMLVSIVLSIFVTLYLINSKRSKVFSVNGVEFKLIEVPSGSFMLGTKDDLYIDETPQTEITMNSFYIGETEVTKALWYAIMTDENAKSRNIQDRFYPIYNISYNEICIFIKRLNNRLKSQIGNLSFRLPTEIEWEYAAKGGVNDDSNTYSGSNNVNEVGWYEGNSFNNIHKVSSMKPNKLGLYDMSGNVWECCSNAYFDYSNINTLVLVKDVDTIMSCVRRGGSWKDAKNCLRTTFRSQQLLIERKNNVGFRLVLSE